MNKLFFFVLVSFIAYSHASSYCRSNWRIMIAKGTIELFDRAIMNGPCEIINGQIEIDRESVLPDENFTYVTFKDGGYTIYKNGIVSSVNIDVKPQGINSMQEIPCQILFNYNGNLYCITPLAGCLLAILLVLFGYLTYNLLLRCGIIES